VVGAETVRWFRPLAALQVAKPQAVVYSKAVTNLLESWGRFTHFAFRSLAAAFSSFRHPGDLGRQLHAILLGALPLAIVAGLALGVVIWMHLRGVLFRLNPEYVRFLPQALSLAVVLEFAPIGAGLIVAGRSGASLGAELGSMRLTEQIDALEVLGQSPMHRLVGPRVMACMLALPVLTLYIAFLAIWGSYFAEMLGGSLSWTEYQTEALRKLYLGDVIPATLKTIVFGFLVGTAGCYFGMNASGGTEGVGRAATRGVVVSTFLVMISNVILVKVIQVLS
jgi:phospholipid/cholesterol/gamma-HCH transport system permease protein